VVRGRGGWTLYPGRRLGGWDARLCCHYRAVPLRLIPVVITAGFVLCGLGVDVVLHWPRITRACSFLPLPALFACTRQPPPLPRYTCSPPLHGIVNPRATVTPPALATPYAICSAPVLTIASPLPGLVLRFLPQLRSYPPRETVLPPPATYSLLLRFTPPRLRRWTARLTCAGLPFYPDGYLISHGVPAIAAGLCSRINKTPLLPHGCHYGRTDDRTCTPPFVTYDTFPFTLAVVMVCAGRWFVVVGGLTLTYRPMCCCTTTCLFSTRWTSPPCCQDYLVVVDAVSAAFYL